MSLPTYPFARGGFWVRTDEKEPALVTSGVAIWLHPLLQCLITDHVVKGWPVAGGSTLRNGARGDVCGK